MINVFLQLSSRTTKMLNLYTHKKQTKDVVITELLGLCMTSSAHGPLS
jgi:hypothetical protein